MPGRLYPPHGPRNDNPGEGLVWEALRRGLPRGWVAFHSLKLRAGTRFGEADFVVAIPDLGLLLVEVKGGELRHSAGLWFQNGAPMKASPLDQAHGFRDKLRRALRGRDVEAPAVGCACWFPHTHASSGPSHGDLEGIVLFAGDLDAPGPALAAAARRTIEAGNAPRGDHWAALLEALEALWGEDWTPRIGLLDRVRAGGQRLRQIDAELGRKLDELGHNRHFVITGGAGTGKSTLALELARRRAYEGQRVRYLCFTDALAGWVDHALGEVRAQTGADARAVALRARAREIAVERGIAAPSLVGAQREDWTRMLVEVAESLAGSDDARPELLVVDEAQNFDAADWDVVDALTGPDTQRWICHDPEQRFFGDTAGLVEARVGELASIRLRRQERSPPAISQLARSYCSEGGGASWQVDADPEELRVVHDRGDPRAAVEAELARLRAEGVPAQDIAVITLVGQSASTLWGCERLGDTRLVHADHPEAPTQAVVETFLRFQGLDRPVLVICELDQPAARRSYAARMHMALTRASAAVVIVAGDGALATDERLRAIEGAPPGPG